MSIESIIRSKTKKIQEKLTGLIQDVWVENL
jgi:hypothetical protein